MTKSISRIEKFANGVPEMGPTEEWATYFGATQAQAAAISHFLDQSVADFNFTGEFNDDQFDRLQAIWDNKSLDQSGQVAEIIKLLGI